MRIIKTSLILATISLLTFFSCTHDDAPEFTSIDPGTLVSADELLVKKFSTAPVFDGDIDVVWDEARPLVNRATVSPAGNREIPLNTINSGTDASLEPTDLFDPYTGESYKYSLRGGHDGEFLYLLF